jgi:DNA-binding NarL/FixJ family response regulator
MTTSGCHTSSVSETNLTSGHSEIVSRIKEVRAQAIEHTILARQLSAERRELMEKLIRQGVSQAAIARELGVSRQAIQKMLSC